MEGWSVCSPQGNAATHCYKHSQAPVSSLALLPIHPTYPLWTPDSPSAMTNSPCHTPQLDPCLETLCVCVCLGGGGKEGERVWLVSWCLPPAVTQYLGNYVCVCVGKKRAGSWGTHPARMLCHYLSSAGYESQGTVSGKRERLQQR